MTNGEALNALNVALAIPLDLRPDASYMPALILLRSDLMRISRGLELQRQSIIADAMEAAKTPADFQERLAASRDKEGLEDPELAEMIEAIDTYFNPAWEEVAKEDAHLRRRLLTPEHFGELYSALTSEDSPARFKVGDRDGVSVPNLLAWIADYLIGPED